MKTVKMWFVDMNFASFDYNDNFITREIRKMQYSVELDSKNPDYVFFGAYTSKVNAFKNAVRIFYSTENVAPDFNLYDYVIGFYDIAFGDRYLRYPLYLADEKLLEYDDYRKALNLAQHKHESTENNFDNKGFCSIVVSREGCIERETFFEELSKYKPIASGGTWKNNIGTQVLDKLEFSSRYKFAIAFENSSTPGYTTEKIVQAFAANTVPIYWGNPDIEMDFNEKAFINVHKYKNTYEVIEEIKRIDCNQSAYLAMLREPAFKDGLIDKKNNEFNAFLRHIFEQPKDEAFRRHGQEIERYEKMYLMGSKMYKTYDVISYSLQFTKSIFNNPMKARAGIRRLKKKMISSNQR